MISKKMEQALEHWLTYEPSREECESCKEEGFAYCYCELDAEQEYADTIQELREQ